MSKTSPFTNSSFASSSSSLLENIKMYDDNDEYVPILTFRQRFLNDSDSDSESEDENAADTSVPKRKRKQALQLPPPPTFEPLVHPSPLCYASVWLPSHIKVGVSRPIILFLLFFTMSMMDTIVANTNKYTSTKDAGVTGRQWEDITRNELLVWVALVIYQGLFKLPSHDQYWNEDPRLPIHQILKQMIFKCFESIKRFLHVSFPAPISTLKNYFDKVEPLLFHVCEASKRYYTPGSNVSVNEMMIRFSEKSVHTVRMKNKPVPKSFKIFSLCESEYTYTFLPISRIALSNVTKVNSLNKVGVPLFQHLRQISVGACETVRKTAARFPKELKVNKGAKLDWDIHSDVEINGVLAIFWQDNGPVMMLSTIHSLVAVFGSEPKKKLKIPKVIDDYNHNMNGSMQEHKEFRNELVWDLIELVNDSDQRLVSENHLAIWKDQQETCYWCVWLASKNELDMDRKTSYQSQGPKLALAGWVGELALRASATLAW
ncbi:21534_t:CDS:2, partial [Cetraspora pellucida]